MQAEMNDFMMALQDRFSVRSQHTQRAERDADTAYDTLHAELDREHQRLLLHFRDACQLYCDEVALDNFVAGFRLAYSIQTELATLPPFSFEQEGEKLTWEGKP